MQGRNARKATLDDVEKWNDIDELKKANPNMGVSVKESFFMDEIAVAEGSLSKKAEFLTKYCNIKQNSSIAWLEYQTVENAGVEKTLEDFRDCYAVGGIDLSQTTDLTAASVVIQKDGTLYAFTQFFMPRGRLEYLQATDGVPYDIFVKNGLITLSGENYVDYHDVYGWFTMLLEDYGIRPLKIGYDRYSAQYLITDMANYGFHMDDVYQGENLTPVIREFEGIIKDGDFKIADNNLLKTHFLRACGNAIFFSANRLQYASNATKLSVSTQLFDRALLNRNGVMDIWNMAHVEDGEKYYIRKEYTEVSELQNSNGKPQIIIQQAPIATGQQAEPQQTPPATAGEPAGGLGEKEGVNNAD